MKSVLRMGAPIPFSRRKTLPIKQINRQTNKKKCSSVPILMINCVIKLFKWLWNHEPQASGSAANFDNFITKLIFNKRTDAYKTDVNLVFTITRPETGQMPGINKVFERQVWRVQVAHLHSAARASPSKKFYPSVLLLMIIKEYLWSNSWNN